MKEHPEFFDTLKWAIQFCQKSESLIEESDRHILDVVRYSIQFYGHVLVSLDTLH